MRRLLIESLEKVQQTAAVILAALLTDDNTLARDLTEGVEPAQTVTTEAA